MQRRHFLPAVLAVALSGCATLQRPIAPEVIASRVRVVDARLPEIPRRTLQRRIAMLVEQGRARAEGHGQTRRYKAPPPEPARPGDWRTPVASPSSLSVWVSCWSRKVRGSSTGSAGRSGTG